MLAVFAHPWPHSFTGSILHSAVRGLQAAGHSVEIADLYAEGFDPVLRHADYAQFEHKPMPEDVRREQARVDRSDALMFVFPVWWWSFPAMLKGWFDRVFTRGFAYLPGRKYDTGLMAGKLAMVSVTTGTSADTYAPDGIDGAILDILWPVHNGILRYTGFDVLAPFITHMPGKTSHDGRRAVLGRYVGEIRDLASRQRLFFHPRDDYGPDERLLPGVRPQSGFQHRNCG